MKIYECSPYFNEDLVAQIKISEANNWVDELHIVESNATFTYKEKGYNFKYKDNSKVKYHQIDGLSLFKKPRWGISRYPWFIKYKKYPWFNEAVQRNIACSFIEPNDEDIILLTDLDEIIDSRFADWIVDEVKRFGIIALKLHYTEYFFNLFVDYRSSPLHHWCYRSFAMSGKYFRNMKETSDGLRRLGTSDKLTNKISCIQEHIGFHHSWIGKQEDFINKLLSYSHDHKDHHPELFYNKKHVNQDFINKCIAEKKSIYGDNHKLYADTSIELMKSVENMRKTFPEYFIPNKAVSKT